MPLQALDRLISRADALLARLETVLPHAPTAPDWSASIAFRYRKRGSAGVLEPVRHVAPIRHDALVEVEPQKERLVRNTAQFVAGHLHPCVSIGGRGGDRLRLACFHFGDRVGVLPAFGSFTGMHPIARRAGDRVYVVGDDLVAALPV